MKRNPPLDPEVPLILFRNRERERDREKEKAKKATWPINSHIALCIIPIERRNVRRSLVENVAFDRVTILYDLDCHATVRRGTRPSPSIRVYPDTNTRRQKRTTDRSCVSRSGPRGTSYNIRNRLLFLSSF